jgi:hypothetical protein
VFKPAAAAAPRGTEPDLSVQSAVPPPTVHYTTTTKAISRKRPLEKPRDGSDASKGVGRPSIQPFTVPVPVVPAVAPSPLLGLPTAPSCSSTRPVSGLYSAQLSSRLREIYSMHNDDEERVFIANKSVQPLEGECMY